MIEWFFLRKKNSFGITLGTLYTTFEYLLPFILRMHFVGDQTRDCQLKRFFFVIFRTPIFSYCVVLHEFIISHPLVVHTMCAPTPTIIMLPLSSYFLRSSEQYIIILHSQLFILKIFFFFHSAGLVHAHDIRSQ